MRKSDGWIGYIIMVHSQRDSQQQTNILTQKKRPDNK